MSASRGEGRAKSEKGQRVVGGRAAMRQRRAAELAEEAAWAARSGPVEVKKVGPEGYGEGV